MKLKEISKLSFLIVFMTIILYSCSNENLITSPSTANSKTKINKTTVDNSFTGASTINTTVDTIITLPNSKMTISIKKGLPASKIRLLDEYFSQNKNISTLSNSITPNLRDCTTYYEYDWVYQNQYRSVSGKHLGIWASSDVISLSKAYNQYGFNEVSIDFSDTSNAFQAGFKPDSIMIFLNTSIPDYYITNARSFGYYFFDEPVKNGIGPTTILGYAETILQKNSNSKCLISEYKWTKPALCNAYFVYDGPTVWNYLESPNMGVMCDQYWLDNECGTMVDFWNEYFNYYNPFSFSDWMDNTMNNSGGWSSCFSWANSHINQIWLFADGAGNESVIQNYCQTAWYTSWLLRFAKQLIIIWKCNSSSPCTNCSYPSSGNWYVYESYYTGVQQYLSY